METQQIVSWRPPNREFPKAQEADFELPPELIDGIFLYLDFLAIRQCYLADPRFHVLMPWDIPDIIVEQYKQRPLRASLVNGYFDVFLETLHRNILKQLLKRCVHWNGSDLFRDENCSGCEKRHDRGWHSSIYYTDGHERLYLCDICDTYFCYCFRRGTRCLNCDFMMCIKCLDYKHTCVPLPTKAPLLLCGVPNYPTYETIETKRARFRAEFLQEKQEQWDSVCVYCEKRPPSDVLPVDMGRCCLECARQWYDICQDCHQETFYGALVEGVCERCTLD